MPSRTPLHRTVHRALQVAGASSITRRRFLRTATRAAFAGAVMPSLPQIVRAGVLPSAQVAVVGAGAAGLTAAYRLIEAGVPVAVFDSEQRLGGRMMTRHNFNDQGMFVESGGELVDTGHEPLISLARELGIEIQSLLTGADGASFFHFNGKTYLESDVVEAFAPLAQRIAAAAETVYDDDEEFTGAARALDATSLADWLANHSSGVSPWLLEMIEAAYVTEYGAELSAQSALNLIDFIDPDTSEGFKIFGDSDEAWRIAGGSSALTDALAQRLEGRADITALHRLTTITQADKKISLTFQQGSAGSVTREFDHVILALPFTALREVRGWDTLPLSAGKKRVIRDMAYGRNVKLMLGFEDPHWRTLAPSASGDVFAGNGIQCAWDTSRMQDGTRGILTVYYGGSAAEDFKAGKESEVVQRLNEIFPGIPAKFRPGEVHAMNWPRIGWVKASYSQAGVGQYCDFTSIAAAAELEGHLFFAGEHTSVDYPGYMCGGFDSGERAAAECLQALRIAVAT